MDNNIVEIDKGKNLALYVQEAVGTFHLSWILNVD